MITKAGLLLFRTQDGVKELLFVRAKGKEHFVFPGGKQEEGETIAEALQRELNEELGTSARNVTPLGKVIGATPDGRPLTMHLYTGELEAAPKPMSEIEELQWMSQEEIARKKAVMTPMTLDHVLLFLSDHHMWAVE